MQFFKHGHQLITDIDKELRLTLRAIQQMPYQNRIAADFRPRLIPANQATDKFLIFRHVLQSFTYKAIDSLLTAVLFV